MPDVCERRSQLVGSLFPDGIPQLWCPPITHYDQTGRIDRIRMECHLAHMSRWVKTFLLLGSTGDGWELTREEKYELISITIELAKKYHFKMLIGILEPEFGAARQGILDALAFLKQYTGKQDALESMVAANVCGFTVCPPRGESLAQNEIQAELRSVLDLSVPTALYQLPQITQNEMSAETVVSLAMAYPNFYLFKDTSGKDKVALSGEDFKGVFFVRGAEGDYDQCFCQFEQMHRSHQCVRTRLERAADADTSR